MQQGFVKTSDGAYIYYEVEGEGRPIVFVHGWSASGKFYARNVEGLKDRYKVVTVDLRGHGRSSKGTDGYTIDRLAQDVHEVVEALGLEGVFLLGWSMGGPTVLSYWKQFGKERGHLAALGLIDMTPYPFHPGDWNSHGLKNFNAEGFNAFATGFTYNHEAFVNGFVKKMFVDGTLPEELNWIVPECMKLLPHIGVALYGDYCYSDYTDVLPTISVPVLVTPCDSGIFPKSVAQGEWIAAQCPNGKNVPFYKGGHMLFWVEAEKFNAAVAEFFDAAK